MTLKKNCVLVFSFMYLVSVDPMDRSLVSDQFLSVIFLLFYEILIKVNHYKIQKLQPLKKSRTYFRQYWFCAKHSLESVQGLKHCPR